MFTDIKKLRTFVTIIEEGSCTSAATRLNTAQPWVSVQLKQLEDMLQLNLVERTAKGKVATLSPQGREFFAIAKKLLASCAEASDEIRTLRERDGHKLILGVDPITLYIPERNRLITQFMTKMSNIDLRIVSRHPCDLFAGLSRGEFDLILTSHPAVDPDFETLPLYEYDLRLAVPKGYVSRAGRDSNDVLTGAKVLVLPDSYHPPIYAWLKTTLAPANVSWLECPETSFEAMIRYAAELRVPTLTPDFSDSFPELRNAMEMKSLTNWPLKIRWGLMRRKSYIGKAAQAFWRMADEASAFKDARAAIPSRIKTRPVKDTLAKVFAV